ncbi:MAG: beta-lactamase family protein [Micrococcales bacterium]|nr:beta-lactamase family protein [Micrococcales bacterium]
MGIQFMRCLRALPVLAALVAALMVTAGHSAATPSDTDPTAELRRLSPGGAVAWVQDGRISRVESSGSAGDGRAVDDGTRFLWGSVSKPVAASVATRLEQEGRLDLSASVSSYVPGGPDVPVADLLDHTAGLPFGAEHLDIARPGPATRALPSTPPTVEPGHRHSYSNLGYLYLQAVLESAGGRPYSELVAGAGIDWHAGASTRACDDLAQGHRLAGPFAWPVDAPYDEAGAAYGYTCGSIRDLATFASSSLAADGSRLRAQVGDAAPTGTTGQAYGRGWRVTREPDGRTTVWHTGTVPGYFSAVYLDPDTRDGVVVLLNASGYLHEEALAGATRAAYDLATGRPAQGAARTTLATGLPLGLVAAAGVLLVAALRRPRASRAALAAWVVATLVAWAALPLTASLMGVPLRYLWLWEPALVVGTGLVAIAATVGALRRVRATDRAAARTAAGRPPRRGRRSSRR